MTTFQGALSAYIINSAWQVPAIFLTAWLVTSAARRCGPALRHRMWVAAFGLEVLLPAAFFLPAGRLRTVWPLSVWRWLHPTATPRPNIRVIVGDVHVHSPLGSMGRVLSLMAAAYLLSLLFFTARLLWNLYTLRRLRRQATPAVLPAELQACWDRCKRHFRVSDVELVTSSAVCTPVTLGVRRKLVLLPTSFLDAATVDDFSSAAAHELAHVRRADFAKNLVYRILSLPIAYHPFSRWTLARIAETREMVCDSFAAEAVSGARNYAHFLLRLASTLASQPSAVTPHAIGIFDAHTLERRIMYLKQARPQARFKQRLAFAAVYTVVLSLTCASALALRWTAPVAAPLAAPRAAQPGAAGRQSEGGQSTPIRVRPDIMSGQIRSRVDPEYPPTAKAAGVSGSVVLHAIIGKDGTMKSLQVLSGPPQLQISALEAVRQWVYTPYLLNGLPVDVDTTITVNYMLAN